MLGGADNANGELPSYITGANKHDVKRLGASIRSYSLDVMIVLSRSQRKALIR